MKTSNIFLILLLTFVSVGFAQKKAKKTPADKAEKVSQEMTTAVQLSADQKQKVYQAHLTYFQKEGEIKQKIKEKYPSKQARKTNKEAIKQAYAPERKAIKATRKEALKVAVTEEQWAKWKAYKKQKKSEKKTKKGSK